MKIHENHSRYENVSIFTDRLLTQVIPDYTRKMLTRPTRDFHFIFIKRIIIGVNINSNEHLSNCSKSMSNYIYKREFISNYQKKDEFSKYFVLHTFYGAQHYCQCIQSTIDGLRVAYLKSIRVEWNRKDAPRFTGQSISSNWWVLFKILPKRPYFLHITPF